jgi:hypothetical protein
MMSPMSDGQATPALSEDAAELAFGGESAPAVGVDDVGVIDAAGSGGLSPVAAPVEEAEVVPSPQQPPHSLTETQQPVSVPE